MNEAEYSSTDKDLFREGLGALRWETGVLVGDGLAIMPLSALSAGFPSVRGSCEIRDYAGTLLATVLTVRGFYADDFDQLTDAEFLALVSDATPRDLESGKHTFGKNWLAVEESRLDEYKRDFMDGSALWGGFSHEGSVALRAPITTVDPTVRYAIANIEWPTAHHGELAAYSVLEPYSFERFLKLYHLLEMVFDWDFVEAIRALGTDLEGVGQVMSVYSSKEIDLLQKTITSRCLNVDALIEPIARVRLHGVLARKLFVDFKKTGSPLMNCSHAEFDELFVNQSFSRSGMNSWSRNRIKKPADQDAFIVKTAAYFIYRIRCSVAHNRIGEFLFKRSEEEFVFHFGEPLVRAVVAQALR